MGCSTSCPAESASLADRGNALVKVTCGSCGQGMQAQVPDGAPRCRFTCACCGARTAFANPYAQAGAALEAGACGGGEGKVQVLCGGCSSRMLVGTVPGHRTLRFDCPLCGVKNSFENALADGVASPTPPARGASAPAFPRGSTSPRPFGSSTALPTLLAAPPGLRSVRCAGCSRPFTARVPPGGGPCQAKCPGCGRTSHLGPHGAKTPSSSPDSHDSGFASDGTLAGGASSVVMVRCGACDRSICANAAGAAAGGRCRVKCQCGQVNELSIGWSRNDWAQVPVEFPAYWSVKAEGESAFREESDAIKAAVQRLLDETWKDKRTRDSKIRGDRPGRMEKFEVVQVQRNENPRLWMPYFRLRAEMLAKLDDCRKVPVKTGLRNCPVHRRAKLAEGINEVYLFHGTQPSAVRAICEEDFALSMAGINAGCLYGPGLYFAEASSKADEYADDDKQGIFMGLYAMLLCRVVCGNPNYSSDLVPKAQQLVDSVLADHTHHSVLGDREACRGTYREFVVFDSRQVYPEYVVIYRRRGSSRDH